jgi:hypothetical protein
MAQVLIECPETKQPVFTGLDFDESSWTSATLERNSVQCPHCPQMHEWSKKDAWLEGERRPS